MDLILTGRGVGGDEAVSMGLVNRLVEKGEALPTAIALAKEIAAFPPLCMRADRRSAIGQWGLEEPDAMLAESRTGLEVILSGETRAGARRFAEGCREARSFRVAAAFAGSEGSTCAAKPHRLHRPRSFRRRRSATPAVGL